LAVEKKDVKKFGNSEVQNILCGTTSHTLANQKVFVTGVPKVFLKIIGMYGVYN
jgi:hypothetical protein